MKEIIRRTGESLQSKPKESFPREKFVSDIKQGFRITVNDGSGLDSLAEVVTRNGDDLFFLEARFGGIPESEHDEGYRRMNITVRRRTALPGEQGAATLERWSKQETSLAQDSVDFHVQKDKGGTLDVSEFWHRYIASIVDRGATSKYFEFRKAEVEKLHGKGTQITLENEIGADASHRLFGPDTK